MAAKVLYMVALASGIHASLSQTPRRTKLRGNSLVADSAACNNAAEKQHPNTKTEMQLAAENCTTMYSIAAHFVRQMLQQRKVNLHHGIKPKQILTRLLLQCSGQSCPRTTTTSICITFMVPDGLQFSVLPTACAISQHGGNREGLRVGRLYIGVELLLPKWAKLT